MWGAGGGLKVEMIRRKNVKFYEIMESSAFKLHKNSTEIISVKFYTVASSRNEVKWIGDYGLKNVGQWG